MLQLLLVTPKDNSLGDLAAGLSDHREVDLAYAESGQTALSLVSHTPYDLVVVDETLPDMTGLELVEQVVRTNAMINCATVSPLSEDDFHEASEGLGLIAQLPVEPGKADAEALVERLKAIKGLDSA